MNDIPDYILKTYQSAFQFYMNDPNTKFLKYRYEQSPNPRNCKYCNGAQTLLAFAVSSGPFEELPPMKEILDKNSLKKKVVGYSVGSWVEENKENKVKEGWYMGQYVAVLCPACHGSGRDPDYIPQPYRKRQVDGLVKNTQSKHIAEHPEDREDYTDV